MRKSSFGIFCVGPSSSELLCTPDPRDEYPRVHKSVGVTLTQTLGLLCVDPTPRHEKNDVSRPTSTFKGPSSTGRRDCTNGLEGTLPQEDGGGLSWGCTVD